MKAEHRRYKRDRVYLTAMLRWECGGVEVKLTNLSSLGTCAEFPGDLAPGTEVEISRGDFIVPARIAWAVEGKIGIEFADPVNLREFRTQSQTSAASVTMPLLRPVEKLSPRLERRWAEILKQ